MGAIWDRDASLCVVKCSAAVLNREGIWQGGGVVVHAERLLLVQVSMKTNGTGSSASVSGSAAVLNREDSWQHKMRQAREWGTALDRG
eukprot:CAMPEP_0205922616 /NCGR_PEP_ID=MMETSP1325-20131115/14770_1 /ASSEMBLY_ACC=CAM_ASM_000708 /TAXON_ID=236786 /ORGANISM="Florenciella sp., Strain RCC1007" /LENGTH=87 /DNA_ID=CAMNT_0053290661 /DNA_START=131 /DNA_END=389 /DNA_ORIENTATION=+